MGVLGHSEMLVAFLSFLTLILAWIWWWNRNSLLRNWPIVGMLPQLSWNVSLMQDYLTYILLQSRGTFVFKGHWFGNMDFVFTRDSMNIHHILSKNFSNYHKSEELRQIFEPMGDGILNSESDNWRALRRIFHSVLKTKRFELTAKSTMERKILKALFPVLENASALAREVDLQDVLKRFMFDNICLLVLGFDLNSLSIDFPQIPCAKAYDDMSEAVVYRYTMPKSIWRLHRWLRIGIEKKFRKGWNTFDDFAKQCITRKRQQLGESS